MERSSFFNAILSGETYDRVYTAEDYARYFSSFIGNGVFPTPSMNLQAIADGTSMNITLKAGKGWINGYFYENTDDLTLNLAVADGVLNRIDKVVLRLDFINREIKAYVKKGTFSSSPVAPSLVRSSDMYELGLADIKVNKGVTKISQADITDLRHNNNYCGLVAGVLQQIDTTDLFAQFQSTFDIWFQHVKGQLSTDAAGNLQNQIDVWNDFKKSGGKIGTLNFEQINSNVDGIITSKDLIELYNKNSGLILGNNLIHPAQISQGKMYLGSSQFPFEGVYVGQHSTNANGYTALPNGFYLEWGLVSVYFNNTKSVTQTITFPLNVGRVAKCFSPTVQSTTMGNYTDFNCTLTPIDASSMTLRLAQKDGTNVTGTVSVRWFVIL